MRKNIGDLFELARALGLLVIIMIVIGARPSVAQVQTTTAVSGTVTDPSGRVVPGASVVVKNNGTGAVRQTVTGKTGFYSIVSLPPGTYTITVEKSGFAHAAETDRTIQVATPARVDFALRVGTAEQTVTVSGAGLELMSTTTAEISGTISSTLVKDVPIPRENFLQMLVMSPGVVPQGLADNLSLGSENLNGVGTGGGGGGFGVSGDYTPSGVFIGGNRDSATNISIDGSDVESHLQYNVTELQSSADVQQVLIQSGNMNAEFGDGVSAVNVITKSGSNVYHGELYEYLRNNHLDAAPFFTNLLGQKLPNFQQNQFGAAGGGPIKRDKLFFFADYEGMRVRQSSVAFEAVPPAGVFNGNFVGLGTTIYNPFKFDSTTGLRQPFPGNQIPLGPTSLCSPRPTCVDPITLAFLTKWVLPPNTTVNGIPSYQAAVRTLINSDQETVRLDFDQSSKTTIYGRFTYLTASQTGAGLQPLEATDNPYGEYNAALHWTQIINPSMVNDLMVAYARPYWTWGRDTSHGNVAQQLGLKNTGTAPGAPLFIVPGYTLDTPQPYIDSVVEDNYQLKDDFNYTWGHHVLKFGMEGQERRLYFVQNDNDQGELTFGTYFSQACPAGNATCTAAMAASGSAPGGNDLADYLLGAPAEALLSLYPTYIAYQQYYGAYGQDSWQTASKLTINFGLRYEYWSPEKLPNNIAANWNGANGTLQYVLQNPSDYLDPSKCYGACAPLNHGIPRAGYRSGNRDFAPRLGVAYQITPKTTVRAALGIFYDGNQDVVQMSEMQASVPPFGQRSDLLATANQQLPTFFVNQMFPAAVPGAIPMPNSNPPASFRAVLPYMPTPTVYEWSASVQRMLNRYWALELDYLGSHTVHEHELVDLNSARLPQGQDANLSLQQRRIFPQWGRIETWAPINWARYNAFVASLKSGEWHGLTWVSNFTWAKDIAPTDIANSDMGNTSIYAPYSLAGPAQWVPQKSLIMGYSYDLPFGQGKAFASSVNNRLVNYLVRGWTISGLVWFSTGTPQPVFAINDLSGVALGQAYPNLTCNPMSTAPRSRLEWFNTACFTNAPFGTFPNSRMGAITWPGVNNWDTSIAKSFSGMFPRDRGQLQFRADMFNTFNHTQWADVDSTFGDSTFGQVLNTRPAREIQFTLKYIF